MNVTICKSPHKGSQYLSTIHASIQDAYGDRGLKVSKPKLRQGLKCLYQYVKSKIMCTNIYDNFMNILT